MGVDWHLQLDNHRSCSEEEEGEHWLHLIAPHCELKDALRLQKDSLFELQGVDYCNQQLFGDLVGTQEGLRVPLHGLHFSDLRQDDCPPSPNPTHQQGPGAGLSLGVLQYPIAGQMGSLSGLPCVASCLWRMEEVRRVVKGEPSIHCLDQGLS